MTLHDTEMLRKAHFKQQSKRAAGGGAHMKQQLSAEQAAQLTGLFERYNAHKANMDVIVEAMGESVTKNQVCVCLRVCMCVSACMCACMCVYLLLILA